MFLYRSSPRISRNTLAPARHEDGGLAGGVSATDDHDVRAAAHLRLVGRRGIIDAAPSNCSHPSTPSLRYSAPVAISRHLPTIVSRHPAVATG